MKQRLSKKILNICIVLIIIVAIIFIAFMFVLQYSVNGETNMPFEVSKISIISSTDGKDLRDSLYKWNITGIQNNDIYIYIEKNDEYSKQETIKNIKLDDFNVSQKPNVGEIKIYRPIENENSLFENEDENEISELEFTGSDSTNAKKLKISNQGGILEFRCANNNIGTYLSNDDEEINYNELIKKININENDLMAKISFDITITLNSGKVFKAEDVLLQVPNVGIVEKGTIGQEYTDLNEIVFKRIEN